MTNTTKDQYSVDRQKVIKDHPALTAKRQGSDLSADDGSAHCGLLVRDIG